MTNRAALLLAVIVTGASHFSGASVASAADTGAEAPVATLRPGDPVPDVAFVDQLGRRRFTHSFLGHVVVLSFMYTRCRTAVCPLVSAKFERLQETLPSGARLLEVTLDPAYDVPSVLLRYGRLFDADPRRWTLASGDPQALGQLAESFGIGITSHVGATIVHSETLGIIDRSGRVARIVAGSAWQPDEVLAAVRDASGLSSDPWQRFLLGLRSAAKQCGLSEMPFHATEMLGFLIAAGAIVLLVAIGERAIRHRERRSGR